MPYIKFKPDRLPGDNILEIKSISKSLDGEEIFKDVSFKVDKNDKIAFVGSHDLSKTTLFKILMEDIKADKGKFEWGITTSQTYFPKENSSYFNSDLSLIDWLRQYSVEKDETFIRGFLGRMLFSGDESQKKANVLSGGEKVRCMIARMMLSGANFMILDEPTNHLDLEAITSLNNELINFPGTVLFVSHDHQFIQTIANRIIEITPYGMVDKKMTFDEYLEDTEVQKLRDNLHEIEMI